MYIDGGLTTRVFVANGSAVGAARRRASFLSSELGATSEQRARVELVVSEGARNALKHGDKGEVWLTPLEDCGCHGLDVHFVDSGPGIDDLPRAMTNGYSTSGTQGSGLGTIRRQSDLFDIVTGPDGTVVWARFWFGEPPPTSDLQIAGLRFTYPDEVVSGDGWRFTPRNRRIVVVDGVGHGPTAWAAAGLALESMDLQGELPLDEAVANVHEVLRGTSGVALHALELGEEEVRNVAVGNVEAMIVRGNGTQDQLRRQRGVVGYRLPSKIEIYTHPWSANDVVALWSDGFAIRGTMPLTPRLGRLPTPVTVSVMARQAVMNIDDSTLVAVSKRVTLDAGDVERD